MPATKYNKVYIRCDTCNICIGPAYLYQDFFDIGIYKLCPPCYSRLNKNGFLYLGEKQISAEIFVAEIMLLDGTKTMIPKKDLEY